MNIQTKIDAKVDTVTDIRHSTCPHDCPSACALDIEVINGATIGRVRGSKAQTYTAGVVCAKVARYAERIHHPDRLMHPMRRTGPKGSGQFAPITWDEALDEIAAKFDAAEHDFGDRLIAALRHPHAHRIAAAGMHGDRLTAAILGDRVDHVDIFSGERDRVLAVAAHLGLHAGIADCCE